MLLKRDLENVRLREQRDQQLTELNERKQKESVKLQSLNEFKLLAESREVRHLFLLKVVFHSRLIPKNVSSTDSDADLQFWL